MRALRISAVIGLSLIFGSPLVFGAAGSIQTNVSVTSLKGDVSGVSRDLRNNITSLQSSFLVTTPTLFETTTAQASVVAVRPDYSQFLIRERSGTLRPLIAEREAPTEYQAGAAVTFSKGPWLASADHTGSANQTPLPFRSSKVGVEYGLWERALVFGLSLLHRVDQRPEIYFIDRDYANRSRPVTLTTQVVEATYEQVVSEKAKLLLIARQGQRFEDRPQNLGAEARGFLSLADRWGLKAAAGRIVEDTASRLRDEQGRYNVSWGEIEATYEPLYGLLVAGSYGVVLEDEDDRMDGRSLRYATDLYALTARYRTRKATLQAMVRTGFSNTGATISVYSGGVTWEL